MPGVRDDGSEPLPSAIIDYRARGRSGAAQRPADRPLVWAGSVLLLLVGLACLWWAPHAWQQGEAMLRARTCTTEEIGAGRTGACFVRVNGRMTGRFGRGEWRFTPDGGRRDAYVRFADDSRYDPSTWPPDLARLLGGEATTALYWGKDPVAFLVEGRRVDTLAFGTTTVMVGVWGGVMGLSFGVGTLRVLLARRTGRPDVALAASGTAALALVCLDVATDAAWPPEVGVWVAVVALALSVPRRWVHAWAARTPIR